MSEREKLNQVTEGLKSKLERIALSEKEYRLIIEKLGRKPNDLELGMFGALWSEHCGYKNSKLLLKLFPTKGEGVLTETGKENAGAVDIGDGIATVFKIESHNHPSAIEPYQGAATGVGGIVRDIFVMGARPIAILDSLRFGNLQNTENTRLFTGVVSGISGYGNCLGIPTVGGEVYFENSYSHNPLVNVMCLGVVEKERIISAKAEGQGNMLILVGAETGRDGIHGASGLASRADPKAKFEELRPAVQIGNPFLEKLLMEACLDLVQNHKKAIAGICDLGAAGLTAASIESAARGNSGIRIDVAKVLRRESGMSPYEVMLSESQERILLVARKGLEKEVTQVLKKWELDFSVIGEVTNTGRIEVFENDEKKANLPINILVNPPLYRKKGELPQYFERTRNFDFSKLPDISDSNQALSQLLASPNIASKRWIYRQYDQSVGLNTVFEADVADAALLRIKGSKKAIAVTTDGNGRLCYLNPKVGGAIAVAEAARNVVCVGARPIGMTNCLNFGSPENLEVYYQMEETIKGMAEACKVLNIPVISGNVSLYNETENNPIYPTPVVGIVGILKDVGKRIPMGFKKENDLVFLLGSGLNLPAESLSGSEYLKEKFGLVVGDPKIDLNLEKRVQDCLLEFSDEQIINSVHDCSDGGFAVALAECCLNSGIGVNAANLNFSSRVDAALFGEEQSRIVVSLDVAREQDFLRISKSFGVPVTFLGITGGKKW